MRGPILTDLGRVVAVLSLLAGGIAAVWILSRLW